MTTMEVILSELQALRAEVKSMSKLIRKVRVHQEDPTGEKSKARAANNGFNRENDVTDELRTFLNLPTGQKLSRSAGTKMISEYIKANNLRDPNNGRVILPNDALRKLLELPTDSELTFLNIQKYLSKHYVKTGSSSETESSSDTAAPPPVKTVKRPTVKKTTVKV